MPKIKPTSILPYTKTVVPAINAVKVENIANSLSAEIPEKAPLVKDLFRVIYAAESNYKYIKEAPPAHAFVSPSSLFPAVLEGWRKRKTP